jgi:hypothetical protein
MDKMPNSVFQNLLAEMGMDEEWEAKVEARGVKIGEARGEAKGVKIGEARGMKIGKVDGIKNTLHIIKGLQNHIPLEQLAAESELTKEEIEIIKNEMQFA